ncbi:DUF3696 domain-containing protein [Magnetospirillum sp. 15-1]|uniref:AAA family ATPase n=1 Tax=Magnetospirillum sp. 15-1 TaxID=1979370 RepID=UPI001F5B1EC0
MAPLTVIFGANSAGKSSLGHLLLALKQTALSADRKRALNLGDATTLIDLGTFADCLYAHDLSQTLECDLRWSLPTGLGFRDPLTRKRYFGTKLGLQVSVAAEKSGQPVMRSLRYDLIEDDDIVLDVTNARKADGKFKLESDSYKFVRATGRIWPLAEPEKFYRIPEVTMARYQNAGFLADFALATETMLNSISYLGPLRKHPQRLYQWSGDRPEDVGQLGEYAVAAILSAQNEGRSFNWGRGKPREPFAECIAKWLKELGVIHSFVLKPVAEGRKEYEVLIKTHTKAPEVKITDVGFGVSQVLPALVQAFYCPAHSTVWMEQPEIHLHPQVQAELADVFIAAIKAREGGQDRNIQLIIESHSEHFLNRLQRRVAEGMLTPDDVAVYFCKRAGSATEMEPLSLNLLGDIENWPENFFGDEMADLTARTVAAANQLKKASRK